jgi:hypothetical protein
MLTYNILETINNKMLQQFGNWQHDFYDVTYDDVAWVVTCNLPTTCHSKMVGNLEKDTLKKKI